MALHRFRTSRLGWWFKQGWGRFLTFRKDVSKERMRPPSLPSSLSPLLLPPSLPPSLSLSLSLSFFLSFFLLPFLLSHVADTALLLWPGVRPEPLKWESRVQDIDPPETSRLHIISNGESSPRDLHLNTKTQLHSTTSKLQRWTLYAKQLARQEHNPTH